MGFRQAAVISATSFFLGVIFINFNVDHRLLFGVPTEKVLEDGYNYYTTFYNAPLAVKALLHSMMVIGLGSLFAKLHKWDESAIWFDGSSLALFLFGIIMYITVTIPALNTIVAPKHLVEADDRTEAIRVLAAGNTLIAGFLIGVLLMQAGQEYVRRTEASALAQAEETVATEKKDQ